ncbi:MAG: invasion associated locus B family protein [Beijerinckiaceae bacterium]
MIFAMRKNSVAMLLAACLGLGLAIAPFAIGEVQAKTSRGQSKSAGGGKLVATHGAWGVYVASAGTRTCYAAAQPGKREPARLKRDPGYFLISTRPRQGVRNEIAVIVGFSAKAGTEPEVHIGSAKFAMVADGGNLWIKNAAEEGAMLGAMRKGSSMTVHVTSGRGNKTVDHYSLSGITQALARAQKECK